MNRAAMNRERLVNLGLFLLAPVVAIILAALVAGVVLALTGADPFTVADKTF